MPIQLSHDQVVAVNLATKSESYSHRHWPNEVLEAFTQAHVVKAGEMLPEVRIRKFRPLEPLFHVLRIADYQQRFTASR
jgi:hypothetical protein